jgi:hypothetical protein
MAPTSASKKHTTKKSVTKKSITKQYAAKEAADKKSMGRSTNVPRSRPTRAAKKTAPRAQCAQINDNDLKDVNYESSRGDSGSELGDLSANSDSGDVAEDEERWSSDRDCSTLKEEKGHWKVGTHESIFSKASTRLRLQSEH